MNVVAKWRGGARDKLGTKFEVLGSKFRKSRTSDLEPSSVSPVPVRLSLRTQNSELLHPSRPSCLGQTSALAAEALMRIIVGQETHANTPTHNA